MKMEMKRQDMEELFQLLEVYERTYGGSVVSEIIKELCARYRGATGENVSEKRNPGEQDGKASIQKKKKNGSGNCGIEGCRSAE